VLEIDAACCLELFRQHLVDCDENVDLAAMEHLQDATGSYELRSLLPRVTKYHRLESQSVRERHPRPDVKENARKDRDWDEGSRLKSPI
jgi:hypothetical protein